MRIVALDLSLCRAGVCRLVDIRAGQPVYDVETVEVPKLRVPGKRPGTLINGPALAGTARLAFWRDFLVEEAADGAELVAMEEGAFSAVGRTLDKGEQMGVVKLTLHDRGIPLLLVGIQQIKKYATGNGKADKQRVIDAAVEEFGTCIGDEHQADAAWICRIAFDAFGDGAPSNFYRMGVCDALQKSMGGSK